MAFFRKLRAAFGFGDDESEEELNEKFLPYEAQHRTPYINPFKKEEEEERIMESQGEEDIAVSSGAAVVKDGVDELPIEMYNGVLSIINSTIPTFVRECLDVEAEKRAIAKALGPHIKGAIEKARKQIEENAQRKWDNERAEMSARVEQAELAGKEAAERAEQDRAKVMSADAQRKAVTERCRTLENRVAELEAEREQFDLENKSLINKVKVAQVHADDAAHYREEAEDLRKQIAELKEKSASEVNAEAEARWSGEVARLQQEIAAKDADIDTLTKKEQETASELAAVREELNEALATLDIANEVQMQVDKLSDQIKTRDAKIAEMREQWNKKEAEAAKSYNDVNNANLDLKLKYDLLRAEAQKLRDAVADADKDKEEALAELQEHLLKSEKENEILRHSIEAQKKETESVQAQASAAEKAREDRSEDMKKQLEAAAMLIERRDETIKQLNEKINSLMGEISFARVSESESRLKIKQLSAEVENERSRANELAAKLESAAAVNAATEQESQQEDVAATALPAGQDEESVAVADDEYAKPEPELEEAVNHVFKIELHDAALSPAIEDNEIEDSPETAGMEDEVAVTEANDGLQDAVLPIDNTVQPVEPAADPMIPSGNDLLNDDGSIDTAFATSGNDIPALDDDIEWLMPTAATEPADAAEETLPDVGEAGNDAEKADIAKEEPRQQQMSLF